MLKYLYIYMIIRTFYICYTILYVTALICVLLAKR